MSQATPAASALLAQSRDLAAELHRDGLRILDPTVFLEPAGSGSRAVSGLERYRERHIPGAAFMDPMGDAGVCTVNALPEAVYAGSMAEWVRDERLPLTTGSEP